MNTGETLEHCYLKTSPESSYFRVGEKGVLTIKLENMTISNTKGIMSSPHGLVPSNSKEFETARGKVISHIEKL
jgi:hypothetical protein